MIYLAIIAFLFSCKKEVPVPKPKGYFRIDLPKLKEVKEFQLDACDFTFALPDYTTVEQDTLYFNEKPEHPCWLNIHYPSLNGTIYMNYKSLKEHEINQLVEDYHKIKNNHMIKADFIDDAKIEKKERNVYGLVSNVGGDVASSYQFYVTDSTNHFVRGSLYFNATPNVDSLAPAIAFVRKDLINMLETWEWE